MKEKKIVYKRIKIIVKPYPLYSVFEKNLYFENDDVSFYKILQWFKKKYWPLFRLDKILVYRRNLSEEKIDSTKSYLVSEVNNIKETDVFEEITDLRKTCADLKDGDWIMMYHKIPVKDKRSQEDEDVSD